MIFGAEIIIFLFKYKYLLLKLIGIIQLLFWFLWELYYQLLVISLQNSVWLFKYI